MVKSKTTQTFDNVIDMDTLFNEGMNIDTILKDNEKTESDFYRPSLKTEGKDSYQAILKFLPNIKDINKPFISKWSVFLHNPDTDKKLSTSAKSHGDIGPCNNTAIILFSSIDSITSELSTNCCIDVLYQWSPCWKHSL